MINKQILAQTYTSLSYIYCDLAAFYLVQLVIGDFNDEGGLDIWVSWMSLPRNFCLQNYERRELSIPTIKDHQNQAIFAWYTLSETFGAHVSNSQAACLAIASTLYTVHKHLTLNTQVQKSQASTAPPPQCYLEYCL